MMTPMLNSILTIDQATRSGFCLWKPGSLPVLSSLDLGYCNGDLGHIMSAFERYLRPILKQKEVDHVCFETPMLMPNDTTAKLTRLYGFVAIIEKLCHNLDIPCFEIHVRTWRKVFLQSSQLSTDEAKEKCMNICNEFGLEFKGHDECEAFGIMDYVATKKHLKKDWSEPGLLNLT